MSAPPLDIFHCPLDRISLIEASAGTGKTWNICGLYMRLLLERRLEVQGILVVTFTNAATAELRARIRSRIFETHAYLNGSAVPATDPFVEKLVTTLRSAHGLDDVEMKRRLDQALQTFDEAAIFTIHGFCQRALADTPFAAGMPMALELLRDDSEMRLEVAHDFWRRRIASDALPPALASHLMNGGDTPDTYAALLGRQLAKPLSRVLWPPEIEPNITLDRSEIDASFGAARTLWLQERDAIVTCVTDALPRLSGSTYKPSTVATAVTQWNRFLSRDDPFAALDPKYKLDLLSQAKLVSKTNKGKEPPSAHRFFAQAEKLLELRAAFDRDLAFARLRLLRTLLSEGPDALRRAKRERRVVAFDDMLYNVYERLTGGACPWLAGSLRARFPAALIDEFQDTDPLQFAIFRAIYGDDDASLFLVGDPKQAIYSFRNADLHTYLRARNEATVEYTLAENQRSTEELIAALNALFTANDRAFMLPGLDYRPVAFGTKPRAVLADTTLPRAPLQLWSLSHDANGTLPTKAEARRAATAACAAEIARLIGAGQRNEITLAGRKLAAGDIAVLVRSHAQGSEMRHALTSLGVGSVELSQASVYESPDAEEIERLLYAILEPARASLLRAALATEMMGHDADAIATISADETKLLTFVTRFADYRDTWLRDGVGVMLRQLMVREAVNERLLMRADGERRLTNLLHLAECLHEAAESHPAPDALLRWFTAQRAGDSSDEATQLRLESDRNLVQIVTIHKAKGLEYPIVFCPFLWDGHPGGSPSRIDGTEYHDDDDQPVVDFRTDKSLGEGAERIAAGVKPRIDLERAAESLRLVYVALTRAVHRCYVVVGSYRIRNGTTECSRSRLNWLVLGQGYAPADWLANRITPGEIEIAWSEMAQRNTPHIGLAPLPQEAAIPVQFARPEPASIVALAPPRSIPPAWWIGSYSRLTYGARHEGAAVDHDRRAQVRALDGEAEVAAIAADDILRFPRGTAAGTCLHKVFESIDFADPATWPGAIGTALNEYPQSLAHGDAAVLLPSMLTRMLTDVLDTPLPGGFRLADVSTPRKLIELEFNLPSQQLTVGGLVGVLRDHGYPVPRLNFSSFSGYLRGFIDLIFEHDGRFYIVDWKSNFLGDTPAHYGRDALAQAMEEHGYHLQYLLYTLALHRYLQFRRADYSYEDLFGGVFYFFVRGMRPGWIDMDGAPLGVYAERPALRTIESLAALLDPRGDE